MSTSINSLHNTFQGRLSIARLKRSSLFRSSASYERCYCILEDFQLKCYEDEVCIQHTPRHSNGKGNWLGILLSIGFNITYRQHWYRQVHCQHTNRPTFLILALSTSIKTYIWLDIQDRRFPRLDCSRGQRRGYARMGISAARTRKKRAR